MAIASEPSEEEEAIIRGTTLEAANTIFAKRKFAERETWFASTPDLAIYFALRTCQKGSGGQPAVIKVPLYRSDLQEWIRNPLVVRKGFDEGDAPELKGKIQLVFNGEAVRLLNVYSFKDE